MGQYEDKQKVTAVRAAFSAHLINVLAALAYIAGSQLTVHRQWVAAELQREIARDREFACRYVHVDGAFNVAIAARAIQAELELRCIH